MLCFVTLLCFAMLCHVKIHVRIDVQMGSAQGLHPCQGRDRRIIVTHTYTQIHIHTYIHIHITRDSIRFRLKPVLRAV